MPVHRSVPRLLVAALLVVACAPAATPTPSTAVPTSSSGPSPSPTARPTAVPSAPTPTPSGSPVADFTASMIRSDRYSAGESFLFAGLRSDIAFGGPDCAERRTDLPVGATDGIECVMQFHPGVDRVGAYLFPDAAAGQAAYDARLAEHGLAPDADGGCPIGPLATQWPADQRPRSACFVNAQGIANLRVYWPGPHVLVGVLAQDASVQALLAWARGWSDGPTRGILDPWLWGAGDATPFEACDGVTPPARAPGPATLSYEGNEGLWLTDPLGTSERRLPTRGEPTPPHVSTWSPDGRSLAYLTRTEQRGEIWLLDPDTRDDVRLATNAQEFATEEFNALEWSPDGRRLAFTVWEQVGTVDQPDYRPLVWLVSATGGDAEQVAEGYLVHWAPDSSGLLVVRPDGPMEYPRSLPGVLMAIDLAGGPDRILARAAGGSWSPDCRHLLLDGFQRSGAIVIDGLGGRPRLAIDADTGVWSRGSADLLVATRAPEAIWRIQFDGGDPQALGTGTAPVWSDDGTMIAYTAADGLRIMDADGSGSRVVANERYPLGTVRWSPDGRWIAASWEMTFDTCGPRLWGWVIATDGSGVRELPSPYRARWRPIEPPKPDGDLAGEEPPTRGEGCGG